MPLFLRMVCWRLLARRLCVSLVLLSYLAAATGVPVPAAVSKDLSQPFPCQGRACGCKSAEECWHRCCCFSREEHLDWARSLAIEPPPEIDHSADGGWHVARQPDLIKDERESKHNCPHCKAQNERQTCSESSNFDPPTFAKQAPSKARYAWITGTSSLRCRGLSTLWVSTGAVYLPAAALTWAPVMDRVDQLSYSDIPPIIVSIPPSDPPPRQGCQS